MAQKRSFFDRLFSAWKVAGNRSLHHIQEDADEILHPTDGSSLNPMTLMSKASELLGTTAQGLGDVLKVLYLAVASPSTLDAQNALLNHVDHNPMFDNIVSRLGLTQPEVSADFAKELRGVVSKGITDFIHNSPMSSDPHVAIDAGLAMQEELVKKFSTALADKYGAALPLEMREQIAKRAAAAITGINLAYLDDPEKKSLIYHDWMEKYGPWKSQAPAQRPPQPVGMTGAVASMLTGQALSTGDHPMQDFTEENVPDFVPGTNPDASGQQVNMLDNAQAGLQAALHPQQQPPAPPQPVADQARGAAPRTPVTGGQSAATPQGTLPLRRIPLPQGLRAN
jgi:hypothetical protein